MAINTVDVGIRNDRLDTMVNKIDVGSSAASGAIEIYTTGFVTLLLSIPFDNPAFDDAATGAVEALGVPLSGTCVDDGVAAVGRVIDRDDNQLWRFAVPADFALSNLNLATNDEVIVSSYVITEPGA